MTRREADTFARLCDVVLAPRPPLPPVGETDAVAAFDRWLSLAPRPNRVALRGVLLVLSAAGPRLRASLARMERGGLRPLVEALRAAAAVSYYGDARVSALLGYEPRAVARA